MKEINKRASYSTDSPIRIDPLLPSTHINVYFKLLTDTAIVPTRANSFDAGIDLYSDEDLRIKPRGTGVVKTGIALEIPDGFVGLIWDRSSVGSKGVHRFAGVVDSGYRGEVKICLHNAGYGHGFWPYYPADFKISKGDKIAQIIIQEIPHISLIEADNLSDSMRGDQGFGSSDVSLIK